MRKMLAVTFVAIFGVLSPGLHCQAGAPRSAPAARSHPTPVKRYDTAIYSGGLLHGVGSNGPNNTTLFTSGTKINPCICWGGLRKIEESHGKPFGSSSWAVNVNRVSGGTTGNMGSKKATSYNGWKETLKCNITYANQRITQFTSDRRYAEKLECIILLIDKPEKISEIGTRRSLAKKMRSVHSFKRKRFNRSSDSRPELVYTFIEQAVQPGAQVALKCSAVGEPPPRFRWTLDGQNIPSHLGAIITEGREGGQIGIGSNNYMLSTLSLNSARVEHGGRYECRASNTHGSAAHAARLNVYGPPYIRAMNPVKAVAGADLTVWCPYYGFPIDTVKWEGGAGNDPRYHQVEGQLTITSVDRERDKGSWACSVLTPGGELARREVQMSVVSPPVLSPFVFPPGLKAGDRAQLTCTVTSGDMPVYFSWLKDQMPVSSMLQVDERGAEFFSMLLFKSLTAAHSGVYTCVVTNTAGKANTSAELAIKVPPYWHSEPSDTAVLLNGSLTVSCEAKGHPRPSIYWTKFSGSTETSLGGVSDPVVLSNGSLRIDSARGEHSGKYRCRADNGVPPALSKTLTVHINEPARFETPSANVSSKLGETVRLVCVARGDSPLSTSWSHSGRALPNSDYRMSISETKSAEGLRSELVIERADRRDSGVYRCQATNPYGRSDHFLHLAVQEPPEPPANFRVLETTSRSVRLQWRRPYDGNSPVLGYVVQYRRHDSSSSDSWRDAETYNVSVSAMHSTQESYESEGATISGLDPATAYLVRARTVTAQFASTHTRALLVLTLHEPPSRAPNNLRASAPRTSVIELAWQAPPSSSWNGELLGYTVWWWASADGALAGGANVGMEFATVRGLNNKYTIEGLEHHTRYSISVRAFNSAGAGPATAPVNILTQESVPSEGPRGVRCRAVSPQSLKVEWSPPPAHAHHGALLGYKLLYRPEHTTEWLEWEVRGGGGANTGSGAEVKRVAGVETLLLALKPHTNYTVQALAYTAAGDGVPAHPINCATHQDTPGPPAAAKIVATSVTSLAVSWLPPSRPNGPVLYYTVFYRELGRDRPPQTTTVQAEDGDPSVGLGGSTELRSLSEGATYEAWVAAHSAAGEGEPSAPLPATTTSRAGARLLSFGVWARVQCGHSLRLACVWRGEPAPRARWLRGDRPVTHDPRAHLTPHGHLAIHEVDASMSGNYTCSARNTYGSEEVTYRVECATPPSAPMLTLDLVTHKEAKLSWRTTHHPTSPPHGFTIWWTRIRDETADETNRGDDERKLEAGGEAATVILRALSCGASYSVRAIAHSRAGPSPASTPLLVRTKPPVLVWEGGGEPQEAHEEGAEASIWSNSSALAVDARRAVRCGARLVRLQWRRADTGGVTTWRDADLTSLHHHREVVIGDLAAGAWYGLRLWTATETSRYQAVIYAATTTHSGERLRRPVAFQSEGIPIVKAGGVAADTERVLGAVSLAFAALAAIAVAALLLVLLARRRLWPCGDPVDEETRRCSHSVASTDKSVCPEQQNIRNCQHDYKHDKLSPASDVYEISPYATFAVGGETQATLDHTLQFRTFGHRENDALPHRPCRKHPQRHRDREDKHHSDCELQQLSRYEKVRPRHCPTTSYCVPLAHHSGGGSSQGGRGSGGGFSEVYAGDSSAESGPGSLSPRTHHEHS